MKTISQKCQPNYCTLAALSPVGIFQADSEGHYLSVSDRWCEIVGISAAEAEKDGWARALHPHDRERVFAEWDRAVQENLPFQLEYRFQRPDGKITWVLAQAVAEKNNTGAVTGYVGTITDITERRGTEDELTKYRYRLEALVEERTSELQRANEQLQQEIALRKRELLTLHRISQIHLSTRSLKATFQEIVEEISTATGFPIIAIELYDEPRQMMVFEAAKGVPLPPNNSVLEIPADQTLSGTVVRTGQFVIKTYTPGESKKCDSNENLSQLGIKTFICMPMLVKGRAIGTLSLAHPEVLHLDDHLPQWIASLANYIASLTERKQAEEALQESYNLLRAVIDNIPDHIFVKDIQGHMVMLNSSAAHPLGKPIEEVLGKSDAELWPPETAPQLREKDLEIMRMGKASTFEEVVVLKEGLWQTKLTTKSPWRDREGNIIGVIGIARDITDRKRMEEELRESQERLQLFIDHAPTAVAMLDRQMHYIAVSQHWLTYYNLQEQTIIGKSHYEVFPDLPERWKEVHQRCLNGAVERCECDRFERANGDKTWVRWEVRPWRDRDGEIGGIVIFNEDITERKTLEQQLTHQKELLDSFIQNAHVGMTALDERMRFVLVNEALAEINGVCVEDHIGKTPWEIVPDLAPKQEQVFRQVITTGQPVPHFEVSGETPKLPGVIRTWLVSYFPIRAHADRPIGIGIVVVEITDRKQAEEAVNKQKELLQTIFDHIPVMVGFFDAVGQLQMVNREWERILGWSLEQMQSRDIFAEFYPDPEYRQSVLDYIKAADGKWGDFKTVVRDGRVLDTSWANVRLSDGSSIGIGQDISDRKQMEEALRQQFARKQLETTIAQRIHQSLNLEEILNTTVTAVRQFLATDRVIIYRFLPDGSGVVVVEAVGADWKAITGTIIYDCCFAETYTQLYRQGRARAVEDIYTAGLTSCYVDLLAQFQVKANLVVPIVPEEELWGLLVAHQCSGTRQWQPLEIDLLKSLATQAAIAIQKSELYQQAQAEIAQRQQAEAALRQQFSRERLMVAIAQRIRQSLNLEEILNRTVAEVRQFLATDRAIVFRFEPDWSGTVAVESVGEDWMPILGTNIYDPCFEIAYIRPYQEGRVKATPDIYAAGLSQCHLNLLTQFQVKANLVVPILQGERLWGLLIAHHCRGVRQWQQFEIDLLQQLATQVAIAIQQSELYKQTQHQALREQTLNRVIQTIRNSLDLTTIFSAATCEIAQLLEADRAEIIQYLPERKLWLIVADYRQSPDLPDASGLEIRDEGNPLATQLKRLEVVRIDDIGTCKDEINKELAQTFPGAWLLVPLHCGSTLWGSLSLVRNRQPSAWTDSEVELTRAVADQLAIALQQAELYQQSRTATATAVEKAEQLEQALQELQRTQAQLVQSEKMSSLGQLVAGVAHEINNPVSFIYANLTYASEYTQDLLSLIQLYQEQFPNPTPEIESEIEAIDLDFLIEDLPKLLCSMKVGAERICEIVGALRNFSRLAEAEIKTVDIHEGLDSTLTILQNRLKAHGQHPEIRVIKEYGNLPKVECYAGQLNQVFMNLLSNAIDALEELHVGRLKVEGSEELNVERLKVEGFEELNVERFKVEGFEQSSNLQPANLQPSNQTHLQPANPCIRITTEVFNSSQIVIRIADNGSGMTEQVKARIFDPFFTTKPVGTGTGLGLSISYQIVVEKHGGQLHCFSELGQGTEFAIHIPLTAPTQNPR